MNLGAKLGAGQVSDLGLKLETNSKLGLKWALRFGRRTRISETFKNYFLPHLKPELAKSLY
jgi:hypothetical protein